VLRLLELSDDVLSSTQRDKLEAIGLISCADVLTAPDGDLAGVRQKAKLRAAASLGLLDIDWETLERLLAHLPAGAMDLVKADPQQLSDQLNEGVDREDRITVDTVLELQEQAAVALLRVALDKLLQRGWANQLAGFVPPEDANVQGLLDVLRTCGTFDKGRPYLASIDELFVGMGGLFGAGAEIRKTIEQINKQPDEMEARRAQLKRDVGLRHMGWPPGPGIETIIGMDEKAAAALVAAGYTTVRTLRAAHPSVLGEATGLDPAKLETWRRQADLQARPGISPSTAYACVTFDDGRVYRHLLGLSNDGESLPDSVATALYRHGRKLRADKAVPDDPFPYGAGLAQDQQTLLALSNLHREVRVRNVLLDPDTDITRDIVLALQTQWAGNQHAGGPLLTPVNPTFFSTTPPPYPASEDLAVDAANRAQASAAVHLVIGGSRSQVQFPAGLTLPVVPKATLEADTELNERYLKKLENKEPPNYWVRIDAPALLWELGTPHFQLRELYDDKNFGDDWAILFQTARLADARRDRRWNDFGALFPLYAPVAILHTAERLERLREAAGGVAITISSGYRIPKAVPRRRGSRHMWGTAIDATSIGRHGLVFTDVPELGTNAVAFYARMLLPPLYNSWDAHFELSPLPPASPADFVYATYVEDQETLDDDARLRGIPIGSNYHLHFDWGYPTKAQEEQIIDDHQPSAGTGPATGRVITIRTAPYDPDDWMAGSSAEELATALRQHIAAVFKPGTPGYASVPPPVVAANTRLSALVKAGFPAVEVELNEAVHQLFQASAGQQSLFAQAVIGGLLARDSSQLAVVHGRVLGQQPNGTPVPMANVRVGLTLGPTTDSDTDSTFGGQLGTEYQSYNETLTDADGNYDLFLVAPARGKSAEIVPVRILAERAGYGRKVIEYTPTTQPNQKAKDIILTAIVNPGGNNCPGCAGTAAKTTALTALLTAVALRALRRR
jgi:hypothetical protein